MTYTKSNSMLKRNVSFSLGYFTHKKVSTNDSIFTRTLSEQSKTLNADLDKPLKGL